MYCITKTKNQRIVKIFLKFIKPATGKAFKVFQSVK